eukprot:scaffold31799_cov33-Phaeocystis_antarctica.AAC.1
MPPTWLGLGSGLGDAHHDAGAKGVALDVQLVDVRLILIRPEEGVLAVADGAIELQAAVLHDRPPVCIGMRANAPMRQCANTPLRQCANAPDREGGREGKCRPRALTLQLAVALGVEEG